MLTEEAGKQHIWRGRRQEEEKRTSVCLELAHISSQQRTNIGGHGAGDVSLRLRAETAR